MHSLTYLFIYTITNWPIRKRLTTPCRTHRDLSNGIKKRSKLEADRFRTLVHGPIELSQAHVRIYSMNDVLQWSNNSHDTNQFWLDRYSLWRALGTASARHLRNQCSSICLSLLPVSSRIGVRQCNHATPTQDIIRLHLITKYSVFHLQNNSEVLRNVRWNRIWTVPSCRRSLTNNDNIFSVFHWRVLF